MAIPFAAVAGFVESRRRLLAGLAAGAVAVAGLALIAFGSAADAALDVADSNQARGTSSSVPNAISDLLGASLATTKEATRILYLAAVAALLVWVARGADWVRAAGWAALGLLIASNYLTPWYAILPLPLAAIARDRALTAGSVLLSAFMLREQVPGLGG